MITLDDLKTNRDTQITVGCIAFFLIAFPLYFGAAGANASSSGAMGGVADYNVNGELTYIEIADGIEYIADGDTLMIDNLHTDSVDGAKDMNIVGVRVTMSYGEDETTSGQPCVGPLGGQDAADTISGSATHGDFNESADGQNGGQNSAHNVTIEWFNSSMVGATISGLSETEIVEQIDSMGAGLGAYSAEIGVSAEEGSGTNPLCNHNDDGEEVTYSVELIIFDYTIAPDFNEAEL